MAWVNILDQEEWGWNESSGASNDGEFFTYGGTLSTDPATLILEVYFAGLTYTPGQAVRFIFEDFIDPRTGTLVTPPQIKLVSSVDPEDVSEVIDNADAGPPYTSWSGSPIEIPSSDDYSTYHVKMAEISGAGFESLDIRFKVEVDDLDPYTWQNILDPAQTDYDYTPGTGCTDDGTDFTCEQTLTTEVASQIIEAAWVAGGDATRPLRITILSFGDTRFAAEPAPTLVTYPQIVPDGDTAIDFGGPGEHILTPPSGFTDVTMHMATLDPSEEGVATVVFRIEVGTLVEEAVYDYLGEAEDTVAANGGTLHLGELIGNSESNAAFNAGPSIMQIMVMLDRAVFSHEFDLLRTYLLRDRLAVGADLAKLNLELTKLATSRAAFGSDAEALVILLLSEGVAFSDTPQATYEQLARIIAKLVLTGAASNYAQALVMVLDALVAGDLAEAMRRGDIADTVALNAAVEGRYRLVAMLLDRMLIADLAKGHFTLSALVLDRLVAGADLSHTATVVQILRDSIGFSFTLTIDGGEYIAWVMNTASKGVTRYSNYPFNSFLKVGDTQFAVSSGGVHRLGGDSDNGADINAQIRLGLADLGNRKLKRVPEAYIGMSSKDGGTLLLKVITVDEVSGEKTAYVYQMAHRPALATRENRRKFGAGLKSVDWDFEIANVDGKHFDLASVQFRPVILDRRTRG